MLPLQNCAQPRSVNGNKVSCFPSEIAFFESGFPELKKLFTPRHIQAIPNSSFWSFGNFYLVCQGLRP